MEEIKLNVSGETKDFVDSVNAAANSLENFGDQSKKTGNDADKLDKHIEKLKREFAKMQLEIKSSQKALKDLKDKELLDATVNLNNLRDKAKKAAEELRRLTKVPPPVKIKPAIADASYAMQNMGRVMQDLPFGLMAIQNNISPLLESFVKLRKESDSLAGTFKAFGKSMMGASGFLFLMSALPAILLIAQNGIMNFSKKVKDASSDIDDMKKSMKDYNVIARESYGTSVASGVYLTKLTEEFFKLEKGSKAYKDTLSKIRHENEAFGDSLANGTINASNFSREIDNITRSLFINAQIQAYTNEITKITELSIMLKEQQSRLIDETKKYSHESETVIGRVKQQLKGLFLFGPQAGGNTQLAAYVDMLKAIEKVGNDIKANDSRLKFMIDGIGTLLSENSKVNNLLISQKDETKKGNDALKERIALLEEYRKKGILSDDLKFDLFNLKKAELEKQNLDSFTTNSRLRLIYNEIYIETKSNRGIIIPELHDALKDSMKAFKKESKDALDLSDDFRINAANVKTYTSHIIADIRRFSEEKRKAAGVKLIDPKEQQLQEKYLESYMGYAEILQGAFSEFFSNIAEGGKNAFQSMMDFFKKLIIQLLATAAAALALSVILAGLGLSGGATVGSNFKKYFSSMSGLKLAAGATVSSPTMALIGESGSETIIPTRKLVRMMSENRTQTNINVTGTLSARGSNFIAALDRTRNNVKRFS